MIRKKYLLLIFLFFSYKVVAHENDILVNEEKQSANLLSLMESTWSTLDGSATTVYHSALIELLLLSPKGTLDWLGEHEEIREDVIDKWQHTVFTVYDEDNFASIVALRSQLQQLLKNKIECVSDTCNLVRVQLFDELLKIEIRLIE